MTTRGIPHVTFVHHERLYFAQVDALNRQLKADVLLTCDGSDGMKSISTCRGGNTDMRLVGPVAQSARGIALSAGVQPQPEAYAGLTDVLLLCRTKRFVS
jgi:hypothetical protein